MMMWPFPDDGSFTGGRARLPATDDPDLHLTAQVADRLLADARTRRQRVTVEVQNRVVLLSGTVDSLAAKQAAIGTARGVTGILDICDGMRVAGSADAATPFEQIVGELRTELPAGYGRVAGAPPGRFVLWGLLAAIGWAFLSLLMVLSGWAALAVGCALAGLLATVARHRKSRIRTPDKRGLPPS